MTPTSTSSATAPLAEASQPGRSLLPGLALAAAIGLASIGIGEVEGLATRGVGPLTLALVAGLVLGHAASPPLVQAAGSGMDFAKMRVLRLGIVLYGFRITIQEVARIGWEGVLIDATVIGSTFALAMWIGTRLLRMDRQTSMLIGAGASICGAAAVMATAPVVRGRPEQVTVAMATVVVFGTLATFLYPLLWELGGATWLVPGGARTFGIYIGSTVHEVAQVVAAARAIDALAADAAVVSKMVRVLMLAPFLLALSAWQSQQEAAMSDRTHRACITVPWFAFGFGAVVLIHSTGVVPAVAVEAITAIDMALLATAMAALGFTTHLSAVRRAGRRPLLLALALFAWLVGAGALLTRVIAGAMG